MTCTILTPHVTVIAFFLFNFIEYLTFSTVVVVPILKVSGGNHRHPTIENEKFPSRCLTLVSFSVLPLMHPFDYTFRYIHTLGLHTTTAFLCREESPCLHDTSWARDSDFILVKLQQLISTLVFRMLKGWNGARVIVLRLMSQWSHFSSLIASNPWHGHNITKKNQMGCWRPQWLLCAHPKSHASCGTHRPPTIENGESPQGV